MIVDELVAILGYDIRGEEKIKRFEQSLSNVADRITTVAMAAGVAAATAMAALGKSVIGVSAQFESFETSLETLEGSSEKAKSAMDWITSFAAKTPYDLEGVTAAFIKLRSYGIDPTDDTLQILGDTASAMSKPLDQAVEAFADATSFQFERLREFGLTAQQEGDKVTFQWTKNGETLTRVVKKNGSEIQKFLKDHFGEAFNGAMLRQSKTWSGMMSNLGDSWMLFQKRIGDAGFFATVKGKLADLLDYIGKLADEGTIDRWANKLSAAFTYAAEGIASFAVRIGRHFSTIAKIIEDNKEVWETFKWALLALGAYLFPVATIIAIAALAVDDFLTYMRDGKSVIGDFVEWIQKLPEHLSGAASAIREWIASVNWAEMGRKAGQLLVDGLVASIEVLQEIPKRVAQFLLAVDWTAVFEAWKEAWLAGVDLIIGVLEGAASRLPQVLAAWFDVDLVAIGTKMAQDLLRGLQTVGGAIKEWVTSLFQLPAWVNDLLPGSEPAPNQPRIPYGALGRDPSAHGDALDGSVADQLRNASGNFGRMSGPASAAAAASTINNVNDSSDKSVSVVVNQTVQQATQAPGAAAQATANAVASGAKRGTWWEQGEKF